jgi:UDP-N-acetyl-D-glucosamine dehydrogenase
MSGMSAQENTLPRAARALIDRFVSRKAKVGVVGLGYVGLPLAVTLAQAGFEVTGVDLDSGKVEAIQRGESYIPDVPTDVVARLVAAGKLRASGDYASLAEADGVSVSVPTPLRKTGDPDLSFIVSAVQGLRTALHPEMVVILESTTYPGTTRELVLPEVEAAGLTVGEDLFLAFSPERVDPGRVDWTTINTPKVVGGITPACTEVAASFYGQAIERVVKVSSAEVAEMTKLLENTFRAVNIGLVNEMALICERLGIDVWEVVDAASTKPFGFMKFTPGPGLGGHCIPIDPLYLSWKLKGLKFTARFIELADEINSQMPRYVVQRVQDALNEAGKSMKGARVLVVGVAYKPDVTDLRESPALDVLTLLNEKGARIEYFDPYVARVQHEGLDLRSASNLLEAARGCDCAVIITHHKAVDYSALAAAAPLVFDARNAMAAAGVRSATIVRL